MKLSKAQLMLLSKLKEKVHTSRASFTSNAWNSTVCYSSGLAKAVNPRTLQSLFDMKLVAAVSNKTGKKHFETWDKSFLEVTPEGLQALEGK